MPEFTDEEAVRALLPCHDLLTHIEHSNHGIYYQPRAEDRPLAEILMAVCNQWSGYENEIALELVRQRAGFGPGEWGLLMGWLQQYILALPGVAARRLENLRKELKERDHDPNLG